MRTATTSLKDDHPDLFISYASEDKENFVRPLAEALKRQGLKVWFDEYEIRIGDSLRQRIDQGLIHSQYGLVVISPTFFEKQWTQYELDGLLARQNAGERIVLPILYQLTPHELLQRCPPLAGIAHLSSSNHTVETMAHKVAEVVTSSQTQSLLDQQSLELRQQLLIPAAVAYITDGSNPLYWSSPFHLGRTIGRLTAQLA